MIRLPKRSQLRRGIWTIAGALMAVGFLSIHGDVQARSSINMYCPNIDGTCTWDNVFSIPPLSDSPQYWGFCGTSTNHTPAEKMHCKVVKGKNDGMVDCETHNAFDGIWCGCRNNGDENHHEMDVSVTC